MTGRPELGHASGNRAGHNWTKRTPRNRPHPQNQAGYNRTKRTHQNREGASRRNGHPELGRSHAQRGTGTKERGRERNIHVPPASGPLESCGLWRLISERPRLLQFRDGYRSTLCGSDGKSRGTAHTRTAPRHTRTAPQRTAGTTPPRSTAPHAAYRPSSSTFSSRLPRYREMTFGSLSRSRPRPE